MVVIHQLKQIVERSIRFVLGKLEYPASEAVPFTFSCRFRIDTGKPLTSC